MPAPRLSAAELRARGRGRADVRARAAEERAGGDRKTLVGAAAVEWVRARVVPGGVAWTGLHVAEPAGTRRCRDEADALAVVASSGGKMPTMRVKFVAWDDALVPAARAVAALARAAGYAGARLRTADREAVEARYGARLIDTELREARRVWRAAMTTARPALRRARRASPSRGASVPPPGTSPRGVRCTVKE